MIDASTLDGKYITLTNCNQGIVMFHTGTSMQSRLHPGKLESLWYTTYNADNQTITIQACDGTNRYISWCPDDTNIIWTTVEETDIDNIGEFKVLQKDDQYAFGATRRLNGQEITSWEHANITAANNNARFFFHSNCGANAPAETGIWNVVRWQAGPAASSWNLSIADYTVDEAKDLIKENYTYTGWMLSKSEASQIIDAALSSVTTSSGNVFAFVFDSVNHALSVAEQAKDSKWYTLVNGKTQFDRVKTMYHDPTDNQLKWGNNQTALNYLWKFIPVKDKPGRYHMMNAQSLIYPEAQTTLNVPVLGTDTPTEVIFEYYDGHDDGAFHLKVVDCRDFHCFSHASGNASNDYGNFICVYNTGGWGDPSSWYLEEATDADVAARYHSAYDDLHISSYPQSIKQVFANSASTPKQLEAAWLAAKTYVPKKYFIPVTSANQLVDGHRYAVGAVNPTWTNGPERYYQLVDNTTKATAYTPDTDNPTFDESMIWTFKAHPDMSCGKIHDNHPSGSPVFSMGKGDSNYIIQAVSGNIVNGTSTLNLNAEANEYTAMEFVPVSKPSEYNGDAEQLFVMHGSYYSTTHDGETVNCFRGARCVNNTGAFDRYSNDAITYFTLAMANNSWSHYFRIYMEVDDIYLEESARAAWSDLANNGYFEWLHNIHPSCGEAYQTLFIENFPEEILPTLTFGNMSEKLAEAAQALSAELDNATRFNSIIVNTINDNHLAVTITNAGSKVGDTPLALSVSSDNTLVSQIDPKRTKWMLELNEAGYVLFKNRATGLYIPPMPTTAGAAYGAMVSKAQAGPHQFNKSTDNRTWIHTADNHISQDETTHRHMHSNNAGSNEASVVAAGNDLKGAFSQWLIESVSKTSDEEIAFNTLRDNYISQLDGVSNGINGIISAKEITDAKAAISANTFDSNADNQEAEFAAKNPGLVAAAETAENMIWNNLEGKNVLIRFARNQDTMDGSYWVIDNNTLISNHGTIDESSVWQLHHIAGQLTQFKIFNPALEKYLVGAANDAATLTEDSEATQTTFQLKKSTNAGYSDELTLQCIDRTGNNFIHKRNNNHNVIWYGQNDAGSALKIMLTDEQLASAKAELDELQLPAVPEVPAELWSTTYELGKYNATARDKGPEVIEQTKAEVAAFVVTSDNLPEFVNLYTSPARYTSQIFGYQYHPVNGTYFRIRASKENPARTDAVVPILKWYEVPATATWITMSNELDADFDYEGTLFVYHDEKLACVDNGLYINKFSSEHSNFAQSATDNDDAARVRFLPGENEFGSYEIVLFDSRNVHIHTPGEGNNALRLNHCSTDYPNIKADGKKHNFELEQVTEIPVAIHSDGYGSIVTPAYVQAPSEETDGAVAFVAQIDGDNLKFVEIPAGHLIAPQTHILIQGNAETVNLSTVAVPTEDHIISEHTGEHAKLEVAYGRKLITPEENEVIYVKSERPSTIAAGNAVRRRVDTTDAKFYLTKVEPNEDGQVEIPGGTMAVRFNSANDKPEELAVSLSDGIPTGIEEISFDEIPAAAAEGIYDLQGRRLAAPVKGINIINGHKTLIR
ncbi:MAG: hypothetical protein K2L05_02600 [Muribaculaceae bacterium]|nr:hypothetical protein [Muribaculaceae bacterium]